MNRTTYLYFSAIATALNVLIALLLGRRASHSILFLLVFSGIILLIEEIMINGLSPEIGLATALVAALGLPLVGSLLRLQEDVRYAFQVTGLMFASRLALIPFPQGFLNVGIAPPSIYSLIIVLLLAFLVVKRVELKKVGLSIGRVSAIRQICVGISIALISGPLEYYILKPSPIQLTGNPFQSILYVVIVMTLFVGFGEELLFRGLLQEAYQHVLPASSAIVMVSIQFGIMHYGWLTPLEILFSYGMGAIYGLSFWKTKSLITPISAHALGNIIMFTIAAYPESMLDPETTLIPIIIAAALVLVAVTRGERARTQ